MEFAYPRVNIKPFYCPRVHFDELGIFVPLLMSGRNLVHYRQRGFSMGLATCKLVCKNQRHCDKPEKQSLLGFEKFWEDPIGYEVEVFKLGQLVILFIICLFLKLDDGMDEEAT